MGFNSAFRENRPNDSSGNISRKKPERIKRLKALGDFQYSMVFPCLNGESGFSSNGCKDHPSPIILLLELRGY